MIGSVKSTLKAKKVSPVKSTKTTVSTVKPTDSKVTPHVSSAVQDDLPLVDS